MAPEGKTMTLKYKTLLHYALFPNPIDNLENDIYYLETGEYFGNEPEAIDDKIKHLKNCSNKAKLLNSILKDLKGKLKEYQ